MECRMKMTMILLPLANKFCEEKIYFQPIKVNCSIKTWVGLLDSVQLCFYCMLATYQEKLLNTSSSFERLWSFIHFVGKVYLSCSKVNIVKYVLQSIVFMQKLHHGRSWILGGCCSCCASYMFEEGLVHCCDDWHYMYVIWNFERYLILPFSSGESMANSCIR